MVSKADRKLLREIKAKRSFGRELEKIGKQVRRDMPIQQQVQKQRGTGIQNFFAHKSEKETYGDEGLTFFDSQKTSRTQNNTADLFGIGG